MMKRILSIVLCVLLLVGIVSPAALAADTATIYIRNISDLLDLADQCVLNTWSCNKSVFLTCDLDLSGVEFDGIPLFDGVFDGNGHTITGFSIDRDASTAGLFRRVLEHGTVENLNISGTLTPGGAAERIGGITGDNSGTIRNCTFSGTVRGNRCVGGIAGSNGETGAIEDCETHGLVSGEHRIGGIAGENLGLIRSCENHAEINTELTGGAATEDVDLSLPAEELVDVTDIGGIAGYSSWAVMDCVNSGPVGYLHVGYNIGGIVGRQSGYTGGCKNSGEVLGRKDVGGIIGQLEPDAKWSFSSGDLDVLQDMLDELQLRIDTLNSDVVSKQEIVSADISAILGAANRTETAAETMTEDAVDWVNDNLETGNELMSRISITLTGLVPVSEDLAAFTNSLPDVADKMREAVQMIGDGVGAAAPGFDALASAFDLSGDAMTEMQEAAISFQTGVEQLRQGLGDPVKMHGALQMISEGLAGLSEGFNGIAEGLRDGGLTDLADDLALVVSALGEVADGAEDFTDSMEIRGLFSFMTEIASAFESMGSALERIGETLQNYRDNVAGVELPEIEDIDIMVALDLLLRNAGIGLSALDGVAEGVDTAMSDAGDAMRSIGTGAWHLRTGLGDTVATDQAVQELSLGFSDLSLACEQITAGLRSEGMEELAQQLEDLTEGLSRISSGFSAIASDVAPEDLYESLTAVASGFGSIGAAFGYMEDVTDELSDASDAFSDTAGDASEGISLAAEAVGMLGEAFSFLHQMTEDTGTLLGNLAERPALSFSLLDQDHTSGRELFQSLRDINTALDTLAGQFQDTELLGDLQSISDQLFAILEFLVERLNQESTGMRERIEDISAGETIQYAGTVYQCVNQADVTAETNVGGITGAITLELSFDQEDAWNISALISNSAKYMIFAAVRDCESVSAVAARKTASGGIVGRMDYGAVLDCEASGEVSASGNYTGGVAGYSLGTLQDCRARSNLSADNYLGGIAGYGHDIFDCLAMPNITGRAEFEGSIAGDADGAVSGNFYAESAVGGVNGFSFAGQAQAMEYETLLEFVSDPAIFETVTVTFLADDEAVETVTIPFGGSVERLPEIPGRDGQYWKWDSFDNRAIYRSMTVEGAYYSPVTVLASGEDIPAFLVEGTFFEGQRLIASPVSVDISALDLQQEDVLAAYTLSVEEYADTLTVRMRQEEDGRLYLLDADGAFARTDFTRDGSYIVFPLNNGGSFVYVKGENDNVSAWIIAVVTGSIAALGIGAGLLARKKKRQAKAENVSPV